MMGILVCLTHVGIELSSSMCWSRYEVCLTHVGIEYGPGSLLYSGRRLPHACGD